MTLLWSPVHLGRALNCLLVLTTLCMALSHWPHLLGKVMSLRVGPIKDGGLSRHQRAHQEEMPRDIMSRFSEGNSELEENVSSCFTSTQFK